MKVLYFTAGAAGMYCGSCLRDNALATELRHRGHDVVLLPLYTPTRTDVANVSHPRVFFGGISVYLQQHVGLFRRSPWLLDRLFDSSFLLKMASRRSLPTSPTLLGALTVSMLRGEDGYQRKELDKLVHWLREESPPDVIDLQNSLLLGLAGPLKRAVGRPVCCTLQGEDLFLDGLIEPYKQQALELIRKSVASVDAFITVSEYYRDFMIRYLGLPPDRTHVVPLGVDVSDFTPVSDVAARIPDQPFTVGYFARVAPEKGLQVLADAYIALRRSQRLPMARLEAAGYLGAEHRPYLQAVERSLAQAGLAQEFHYRGALDRQQKIEFFRGLHVFSVPSPYVEPKGLPVLEAMASGIPVVEPRHGAFTELLERTGGGLLVAPGAEGVAEGIHTIWKDAGLASELGRRGASGVRRHYTLAQMGESALEVYRAVSGQTRVEGERPRAAARA